VVLACSAGVFSGADWPASAVSLATLVRVLPVSDEELFKRLKSMTMTKKPLDIWTLAMFSAIPRKTLGPFINERACASACPACGTV
jgi:hypothetical protein